MTLKNKLMIGGLTALAMLASTACAFAATAYASTNVNVRSGPSTQYRAIDTLRRGERVDVQYCQGSWCYVQKAGPDGWVSSNYLDRGRRPVYRPRPVPQPSWNDYYGYDNGWVRPRPRLPQRRFIPRNRSQACFSGSNGYFCFGN
ncbi:SH3 domain-containing protein [Devosia rhodophyticola]|uniref:SH3 domain-containing protein n=1 Tax=Devosia rhodophyticola TaxID=3026423 RepID=A0ABY7YVX6_9HYPH|nr:SH3 domain-containing protein [Devosia rhodophyticola]WDR05094.1 SH3 domain-containing protein [Devosia rhodophyticola]